MRQNGEKSEKWIIFRRKFCVFRIKAANLPRQNAQNFRT